MRPASSVAYVQKRLGRYENRVIWYDSFTIHTSFRRKLGRQGLIPGSVRTVYLKVTRNYRFLDFALPVSTDAMVGLGFAV